MIGLYVKLVAVQAQIYADAVNNPNKFMLNGTTYRLLGKG